MASTPHLQKDITSKRLEEYPDVFADILNVLVFQGEPMLRPEFLADSSTNAYYRDTGSAWHEHRRDVAMADRRNGVTLALISLENQVKQDRDMVFRVMGYDFAAYQKQLSSEDPRRSPVFTLVIYLGPGVWRQPRQLLDALDLQDIPYRETLMRKVSNPHLNVVEICRLPAEIRSQFQSDFRLVAEWFREDRDGLEQALQRQPQKIRHAEALLDFLANFSGESKAVDTDLRQQLLEKEQQEGGLTMKSFMTELLEREAQKGIQEGRLKGLQEGRQEGRLEGRQEGRLEGRLEGQGEIIAFMLQKEKDLNKVAALTGLPLERVRELALMQAEEESFPQ